MKKLLLFAVVAGILGTVAGCGTEPSANDQKEAANNFEQRNATAEEGQIGR